MNCPFCNNLFKTYICNHNEVYVRYYPFNDKNRYTISLSSFINKNHYTAYFYYGNKDISNIPFILSNDNDYPPISLDYFPNITPENFHYKVKTMITFS